MNVGIVGAGRLGSALAIALRSAGYRVAAISSRSAESAARLAGLLPGARSYATAQAVADAADLVFLTVPDGCIEAAAAAVHWRAEQFVVHCSGAGSPDLLSAAAAAGGHIGVFHPLQTFPDYDAAGRLAGSYVGVQGEDATACVLVEAAHALRMHPIRLQRGQEALYHAGAVMVCNYLVTLASLATDLWEPLGLGRQDALRALLPLIRGTVDNLERYGLPDAVTGPIARGDARTVARHLEALEERAPAAAALYRQLGIHTVPIALAKGTVNTQQAAALRRELTSADGGS